MDNSSLLYEELVREKERVLDKVIQEVSKYNPELSMELKVLVRLIEKHKTNGIEQPKEKVISSSDSVVGKSLVQVVRSLFRDNPDKEFSPGNVRDYLQPLIEQGKLKSETDEVIRIAHRTLRSLIRQNFVDKIKREGEYPVYKLKPKEKGLL